MIRKTASGIYTFLPLGYKVLSKIENIVRQEMDATGALESHDARAAAFRALA